MRNFTIIKNSEGCKKWNIEDKEYKGQIEGYCGGWEFEVFTKDGKLDTFSVIWEEGTPEDIWDNNYYNEMCEERGWVPTGRVVFRGYGILYYDTQYRDWCVEDVEV